MKIIISDISNNLDKMNLKRAEIIKSKTQRKKRINSTVRSLRLSDR